MKLTYVAHAIELVLIGILCIYVFILQPSQSQLFYFSPTNTSVSLNKPPELVGSISSFQDVINDLKSLGCQIVNASADGVRSDSFVALYNYSDFRFIAYTTKIVFVVWQFNSPISVLTLYQGLPILYPLYKVEDSSSGAFTRYEKLEFISCYAAKETTGFAIHIKLKNTGSAAAMIDLIFFNGVPHISLSKVDVTAFIGKTLNPGQELSGKITVPMGSVGGVTFNSGMSLELMIQTASGKQYPKVVVLP